jgi:LysM repeat protein
MNRHSQACGLSVVFLLIAVLLAACGSPAAEASTLPAPTAVIKSAPIAQPVQKASAPQASAPQAQVAAIGQAQRITQTIDVPPTQVPTQIPPKDNVIVPPAQPFASPPYIPPYQPPVPAYPPLNVPPVYGEVIVSQPALIGTHIVAPGETLYCIGRAYQVDPVAIAQANGLSGYAVIVAGQALLIPATRWATIPPGPVCKAQFNPNWTQNPTSAPTAPVCGMVQFSYPAVPPQIASQYPANPPVQSLGTFTNGYGETFVMTVTGRRPDAIMAFSAGVPVCFGAARPQPGSGVSARPIGLAAPLAQTPAVNLKPTDVLTDSNTLNLVIEIDLTGAAAARYGPQTEIAFAIDPSIAPGAMHYFWNKYRSSALAYLSASAGSVAGTLYKNCAPTGAPLTVWAGMLNFTPLSSVGNAYYALTVVGQGSSYGYGFNGYNVAGTWGSLEAEDLTLPCR